MDDRLDTYLDNDAFLGSEAYWLERMPPELEWDESDAASLVENVVGGSRARGYS